MSRPGAGLLSDRHVDLIAMRLAERLTGAQPPASPVTSSTTISAPTVSVPGNSPAIAPRRRPNEKLGEGIFATVDDAVDAARAAYRAFDGTSLEGRQKIIAEIRASMMVNAKALARHAHDETGLGRTEHKVIKNRLVTRKTQGTEVLTPQAVTGDDGLTLTEYAPYGVIGAITPTTNPTSTIICNTIGMVAAGNSVVFNVHPGAVNCSMETVRLINRAVTAAGGRILSRIEVEPISERWRSFFFGAVRADASA